MQDRQAASVADPPFEAPRNKGSIGNDALSNGVPQTAQSELSRTAYVLVLEPFIPTYFLWFPDLAVISTATPAITSEFNSLVDVGWYGMAYQLDSAAVTPLTGKLFRSFSIKASSPTMQWTLLTFFFIFEVGSVVCGAAQLSATLITGRTNAGIGCSGISTGALTIITGILPGKAQAQVLGVAQGLG
ncbi:hypothetical protein LTR57_025566 [Friedmanniomyces endolithicus]|nr:hypothetical protein LTR57_025566 [Friedmanniomyces endolithicus]